MDDELKRHLLNSIVEDISSRGLHKRLKDVQDYINETFQDANCTLNNKEDLLNYEHLDFDGEDFDNIIYIIDQNYSLGDPFFLYRLTFQPSKTLTDLLDSFNSLIEEDYCFEDNIEYCLDTFSIESYNDTNLEIKLQYKKYSIRKSPRTRSIERISETPIEHQWFNCYFKPLSGLSLIGTGDRKVAKIVENFIENNLFDIIDIRPLKIDERSINYSGPEDAKKVTIFILDLITQHLHDTTHTIVSHTKVGFKNPSASRLKTLTVGGDNLLHDDAIADQVSGLATLKLVDMRMAWNHDTEANSYINYKFSLYTEGIVKIVIREINNKSFIMNVLEYIYQKILILLNSTISITERSVMEHYFSQVLSRRVMRETILLDDMKDKLVSNDILSQYRGIITNIINEAKESLL